MSAFNVKRFAERLAERQQASTSTLLPSLIDNPPHIVRDDVIAPHDELDDGVGQYLFECWFGARGGHDVFP
ncbi:hypothetical protein ACWTU6_31485 [Mesorhizobium sp. BHbsci]